MYSGTVFLTHCVYIKCGQPAVLSLRKHVDVVGLRCMRSAVITGDNQRLRAVPVRQMLFV